MCFDAAVVARTQAWVERAVIGLNLCPFAKAVHVKGQIHYAVSRATEWADIMADFEHELLVLAQCHPDVRETTLLAIPDGLGDFVEFVGCASQGERVIAAHGLRAQFQLATFHPQYCFAGSDAHDMANFTNRSPYPTFHLLREASISRAVNTFPHAERIFEANIQTLRALDRSSWDALGLGS